MSVTEEQAAAIASLFSNVLPYNDTAIDRERLKNVKAAGWLVCDVLGHIAIVASLDLPYASAKEVIKEARAIVAAVTICLNPNVTDQIRSVLEDVSSSMAEDDPARQVLFDAGQKIEALFAEVS